MDIWKNCIALVTLASVGSALPAQAQDDRYRVNAKGVQNITLTICSPQVRLVVRGDGDTDLDFSVTSSTGHIVHSDYSASDATVASLLRRDGQSCENFNLRVFNLGDVYNSFTVTMTSISTS